MKRKGMTALVLAGSGCLAACTTMVEFTSQPQGAKVTYLGEVIGTTPFQRGISDQFGWWSTYTFTAEREGYERQTISIQEPTPLHAQYVLPAKLAFEMKTAKADAGTPPPAVVAAAAAPLEALTNPPASMVVEARAETGAGRGHPDTVASVETASAEQAVRQWARAWSERDLAAYFAAYEPAFSGQAATRAAWERQRRERIANRKHIAVELADLQVTVDGARARASFRQSYTSDRLSSSDRKALELTRDASGQWRIRQEAVIG